jgi:hypothetical protein
MEIRQEDVEEPLLFVEDDLVWLLNKRRRKGENPKLQPRFLGPYRVVEARANHTYKIERQGQCSVQNEGRLKLYYPCNEPLGKAPARVEPRRRNNMKGATKNYQEDRDNRGEMVENNELPPLALPKYFLELREKWKEQLTERNPVQQNPSNGLHDNTGFADHYAENDDQTGISQTPTIRENVTIGSPEAGNEGERQQESSPRPVVEQQKEETIPISKTPKANGEISATDKVNE